MRRVASNRSVLASTLRPNDFPYRVQQCRNVTLDGIPQNVGVQSEVRVGDDIPQPRDLSPGHVRMTLAQVAREFLDRFTNDMEVLQDGVRPDIVAEDLVFRAALGVPDDLLAALLDVFEEQQRITRHGSLPFRRMA